MIDFCIDRQFLQTHTLSFKLPLDDIKADSLAEDLMLEFEGEFYYIDTIEKERVGFETYLSVTANAIWYRIGDRKFVGSFNITGMTPSEGFQLILQTAQEQGVDWGVGMDLATTVGPYSLEVTDGSYLELLLEWAKICSCEVTFDTKQRVVNFGSRLGGYRGISFRYERNLLSLKRTAKAPQVTRLYPYGRLDLDISGQNPTGEVYIEDYSYYTGQGLSLLEAQTLYRKDETYRDDSFVDDRALYDAAVRRLAILAQPIVSYEASVADLSALTGYDEGSFQLGDTVIVEDAPLGVTVATRISRFLRYPYEPHRNKVELAFMPMTIGDQNVSASRPNSGASWELFEHRNDLTPLQIRDWYTILHYLPLRAQENASWIVNFKLQGVAVGNSTMRFIPFDGLSQSRYWPEFTETFVDGQTIDVSFSFATLEIPAGQYVFQLRCYSDTPGCGVNVAAQQTSFWVLARGVVRADRSMDNSIVYAYTGAVQTFQVPDDVFEIEVEALGAQGGGEVSYGDGGYGGRVVAKFPVSPGDIYDVYVGGKPVANGGGWPNGGNGDVVTGDAGFGGGGASYLIRTGVTAIPDVKIIAAGGGGQGDHFIPAVDVGGGHGGFLEGGPGRGNSGVGATFPSYDATGATQWIGGIGGWNWGAGSGPWAQAGQSGDTAAIGTGGNAGDTTDSFTAPGGGGGGGWHGGGGAGFMYAAGNFSGGGGGGSGWVDGYGYDIQVDDGYQSGHGQITISWANPEE